MTKFFRKFSGGFKVSFCAAGDADFHFLEKEFKLSKFAVCENAVGVSG